MIFTRNELRLRDKVGIWGPVVCLTLALIAIAILAADAFGQERQSEVFDVVGTVVDDEAGHARAFMQRAAKTRLQPVALMF